MTKERQPQRTPLTRKQLSRRQREKLQLRWIWIGIGAIAALVVILLALGVTLQSTQAVAKVNDETIRIGEYQKRVRFWYHYYNDYLLPGSFDNLEQQQRDEFFQEIADQLVDERLIQQEAKKNGLTVSDEEIQIELEETWFQHYRTPQTPTPSPTPDLQATPTIPGTPEATPTPDTPETFQAKYKDFVTQVLQPAGLSESYFQQVVRASLLRNKLETALIPEVPTEEDQVHFRYTTANDDEDARARIATYQAGVADQVHAQHILVATKEEAEAVLERLQAGEDFAALAAELSTDSSNKDEGGDLGWFGRGEMDAAFEKAAFEGEIGLYPVPVESTFGFHVIQILGHEERPVSLDDELYDAGWYGKSQLANQFGPLFAEMVFQAPVGLLVDPVPTEYGVAIVEVLEHQVRSLNEQEQDQRRAEDFQTRLAEIREGANIQNLWDSSMVPNKM